MPQTKNGGSARSVRKDTGKRKARRNIVRQPGQARGAAEKPAIIARSLYSLRVKPVSGIKVYFAGEQKKHSYDGPADKLQLFNDLWECYCLTKKLVDGEELRINPVALGLDINTCFQHICREMKQYAGEDAGLMINKDYSTGRFYLTLYKHCTEIPGWQTIEVKPILKVLKRNPDLRRLFIIFLGCMMQEMGIDSWGAMEPSLEWIEDDINNAMEQAEADDDEADKKYYAQLVATMHNYKQGTAASILDEIRSYQGYYTSEQLLDELSYKRYRHPVAEAIRMGCQFMIDNRGRKIYEFCGVGAIDDGFCGLTVDMCANIIYDSKDQYTEKWCEYIDCLGNEGVEPMTAFLHIKQDTQSIDIDDFRKSWQYPNKLMTFFRDINIILCRYE